jgi:transposase
VRAVERARVVVAALQGQQVEDIAVDQRLSRNTVYLWLQRFDERGVAGLTDRGRSGRPRTSPGEQVGAIVATALTKPTTLGLPVAAWTLDRLVTYRAEDKGLTMKRSRRDEVLLSEGVRWRKEQTWCGERVDADFAATRGR